MPRLLGWRRPALVTAALLAGGLVAAACGSSSPSASRSTSTTSSHSITVKTAQVPGLGTVLVTSAGRTLYLLTADQQRTVTCTSTPCLALWPPYDVSSGATPTAGKGVDKALLGTVRGPRGTQVTYNHWPLYTYAGDSGTGQAYGQGIHSFGGVWWAVTASGRAAVPSSTTTSTTPYAPTSTTSTTSSTSTTSTTSSTTSTTTSTTSTTSSGYGP